MEDTTEALVYLEIACHEDANAYEKKDYVSLSGVSRKARMQSLGTSLSMVDGDLCKTFLPT
jgi:hypothetical protein